MKHLLIVLVFSLTTVCCKSQKDDGPQPTKEPTVYKGVTDRACAVEMAFGSYGSGIDGKAYEKVMDVLKEYKQTFTSKSIGREGETRLCMPLAKVGAKRKKALISRLKKIAKEGQLVSVSIR
jgi:hypothetical protein